jgi:hypothetical protein
VVVAARMKLEYSGVSVDQDRAAVGVSADVLDTGNCAGGEVGEHCWPIERAVKGQSQ